MFDIFVVLCVVVFAGWFLLRVTSGIATIIGAVIYTVRGKDVSMFNDDQSK